MNRLLVATCFICQCVESSSNIYTDAHLQWRKCLEIPSTTAIPQLVVWLIDLEVRHLKSRMQRSSSNDNSYGYSQLCLLLLVCHARHYR
jgi:hypothetical protein